VNSNTDDYRDQIYMQDVSDTVNQIKGGGIVRVSVNCSVSGNPKRISLNMVDKRSG
jgi:hypothetical protein